VNGDGRDDVVLASANTRSAVAYVVYGGSGGALDLRHAGRRATKITLPGGAPIVQVAGGDDFDGRAGDDVVVNPTGSDGLGTPYVVGVR
jgi:hypothetical protein